MKPPLKARSVVPRLSLLGVHVSRNKRKEERRSLVLNDTSSLSVLSPTECFAACVPSVVSTLSERNEDRFSALHNDEPLNVSLFQKTKVLLLLADSPEVGNKEMSAEGEIAVETEKKEVVAEAQPEKKVEGILLRSTNNG